jgi:Transposase
MTASIGLHIKGLLKVNPRLSLVAVSKILKDILHEKAPAPTTIKRYLDTQAYLMATPLMKPLLRPINIKNRLNFANKYLKSSAEFFSSIIWSNKTSVSAFQRKKQYRIRLHSSISMDNRPFAPAVQSGGLSVRFWGAFTSEGGISQVVVADKINSIVYKKLLI